MDETSNLAPNRYMRQADSPSEPGNRNGYLKVPFARCADGIARHVTSVSKQTIGPFTCLDCEMPLTLRQPSNRRAHFAHRPDAHCAGETALHRYAKELLAQRKFLTLPILTVQDEGLSELVFKAGIYNFEEVLPEFRIGSFQPDAIVFYKSVKLAVEFMVTHAVDAEKREKVQANDLSMVEIDLSEIRASQLPSEELDHVILHSAPRIWIHHRKRSAAIVRLADQVEEQKAKRGSRLKGHIEKQVRPAYPVGWEDESTPLVEQERLDHLVNLDVVCNHWFTVPRAVWQSHALCEHVIKPSQRFTPSGANIAIRGEWPSERSLASKIPSWMIRSDLSSYPPKRLAEAGYDRTHYGSPHHAVSSYLSKLQRHGRAVVWSDERQSFFIEPNFHELLHRRAEFRRIVTKLLDAIPHDNPEQGYRSWASSHEVGGATVDQLVEGGGDSYQMLRDRIFALEAMLSSNSSKIVNDLCGLPLMPILDRKRAAIKADRVARALKEKEAASARRDAIRQQAVERLENESAEWLAKPVEKNGASIIEFAGTSDDALIKTEHWLATAADRRRQANAEAEKVAALQAELIRATERAFPNPAMVQLFLNTSQPQIGGHHPIEYCNSKAALKRVLSLLPKRR
jgi:hypothetical protein